MPLSIVATSVAVCSLTAAPLCGSSSQNLVTNGDFGTLDLSGWTLDCPVGGCSIEPDSLGVGGQFRRTIVENAYATLSQTLQLKPGRYAVGYSIRDSSILYSTSVPNELTVRIGSVQDFPFLSVAEQFRYREFVSSGGPTELSFYWFTLYYDSNFTQSMVLDDIFVEQVDDGGAAQSANSALASARDGAQGFVETIFSAQGFGPNRLAARPIATSVAGPAAIVSGKTRAWASGGYSRASWDDSNVQTNQTSASGGVEADAGDGWTAGFAAMIADLDTSLSGPVSAVDTQGRSASFSLYASWEPKNGAVYVRATAGGGFSSRNQRRTSVFGFDPALVDDIDGSHWFAAAESGYDFRLEPFMALIPYARVTAVEAREEAYVEPDPAAWLGASAVDSATLNSLSSQIGLRVALNDIVEPSLSFKLHTAWRHEFLAPKASGLTYLDPTGPALAFHVPGLKEGRDSGIWGGELEAALWDQTSAFIRYDGEVGDGFDRNSGQAGIRAIW